MSLESTIRERLTSEPIALMTHIVCGYPSFDANWEMLSIMNQAGVALVEFQFPFSEPSADGPLFCRANQAALAAGARQGDCFSLMSRAASTFDFAPLMMGYYNTVFKAGHQAFCERLRASGGRGMILPDLPPEEANRLEERADAGGLGLIHLMTPTTSDERLRLIASHGRSFFYCVARRGVTGQKTDFGSELDAFLARCRAVTDLPLAVGFGVSRPEDVEFLKGRADIAIVGTAALKAWEEGGASAYRDFIEGLASACRDKAEA